MTVSEFLRAFLIGLALGALIVALFWVTWWRDHRQNHKAHRTTQQSATAWVLFRFALDLVAVTACVLILASCGGAGNGGGQYQGTTVIDQPTKTQTEAAHVRE